MTGHNTTDEVAKNVAAVRRWFEQVWNEKHTAMIHEFVAPDCIAHGTEERGAEMRGPDGFAEFHARLTQAFPDIRIEVEDCFGTGDKVAVRWIATMHHHGDGLGMAPTGAEVRIAGMGISRWADGKVVEIWDSYDKMGMFQQIEAAAKAKSANA